MLPRANRVIFSINKCQEHLPTFDVFRKSFIDLWAVQLVPMATSAQPAILLYCGLIKRDGETEFHSRFLLPCDGTETLLRVCQTECPFSLCSKLQINWVYLACTAGAPVCFDAVPTSYSTKKGEGDQNVRSFSQFKNSYGKVRVEVGFLRKASCLE